MQLTDKVKKQIEENPDKVNMILQGMEKLKSLDRENIDPQKAMAYLNNHVDYVAKYFQDKNADPTAFAPPMPPKSIKIDKSEIKGFTNHTISFFKNSWEKIRGKLIMEGDGKTQIPTQQDVNLKVAQVKREINLKDDTKLQRGQKAFDPKKIIKAGRNGAALGFLKGGQVGAMEGAVCNVAKELKKEVKDYQRYGDNNLKKSSNMKNSSPKPKMT